MFLPNPNFLNWLLDSIENAKKSVILVNYLAVLDEGDENGPIAKIVGKLTAAMKRGVKVKMVLEIMDKKLNILKYDCENGRVSIPSPLMGEGQGEGAVLLPSTFWQYRWHARLSVGAIHIYLAGEAEKIGSPFAPWWRLKRDEIAFKYGFQKHLVGRAQTELKRFGLLEILYETAQGVKGGRYVRYMNYFRQNPFYDYESRISEMNSVAKLYPAATVNLARKLSALVREDSDAGKFSQLCNLVSKHGETRAKSALQTIVRLAPNSTKRKFEYVEERLEGRD